MQKQALLSAIGMASVVAVGSALLSSPSWAAPPSFAGGGPEKIFECQVIDEPGSYVLANNLSGTYVGGICLNVTANFVTIDLAGFTMSGAGCTGCIGIDGQGSYREAITVMNGTITGYQRAMDLSTVADAFVHNIRAVHNYIGITAGGRSRVTDNIASDNELWGILVAGHSGVEGNCLVSGNTASDNGEDGLEIRYIGQCVVSGNTLNDNGVYGAQIACPSLAIGNIAVGNGTENLYFDGAGCAGIDNLAPVLLP